MIPAVIGFISGLVTPPLLIAGLLSLCMYAPSPPWLPNAGAGFLAGVVTCMAILIAWAIRQ
jgi:hypothetical protein